MDWFGESIRADLAKRQCLEDVSTGLATAVMKLGTGKLGTALGKE
jgi:hypothetical protein